MVWPSILIVAVGFGAVDLDHRLQAYAIETRGLTTVATVESMRSEYYERRDSKGRLSTGWEHWATYAFQAERSGGGVRPVSIERQVRTSSMTSSGAATRSRSATFPRSPRTRRFSRGSWRKATGSFSWPLGSLGQWACS